MKKTTNKKKTELKKFNKFMLNDKSLNMVKGGCDCEDECDDEESTAVVLDSYG